MISIVIPAYNESKRIEKTVQKIAAYMKGKQCEILVIDDGSTDSTTKIAKKYATVITLKKNTGKGFAIKTGFNHAKGDIILFTDADLATPIEELTDMLPLLQKADIVIASRYIKSDKQVKQSTKRKIIGSLFSMYEKYILGLTFKDTQCGFKLYTKKAAKLIASKQLITQFAFDIEQLIIAKRNNLNVIEHPVNWFDKSGSTVRIVRDGTRMFVDTLKIKYNDFNKKYQ